MTRAKRNLVINFALLNLLFGNGDTFERVVEKWQQLGDIVKEKVCSNSAFTRLGSSGQVSLGWVGPGAMSALKQKGKVGPGAK